MPFFKKSIQFSDASQQELIISVIKILDITFYEKTDLHVQGKQLKEIVIGMFCGMFNSITYYQNLNIF